MSVIRPATWGFDIRRRGRALVIVCCLLSLLAGFDQGVLAHAIDADSWATHGAGVHNDEQEPPDDDGEMLTSRSLPDSQREEHKQQRASPALIDDGCPVAGLSPSLLPPRLDGRPGGQHAFRNGVGAPLLC